MFFSPQDFLEFSLEPPNLNPNCFWINPKLFWWADFLDRIPATPQILDQQNQKALLAATTEFFDFIKDNKNTFQILFSESSGNSFTARLVEFLCNGYVPVSDDTDALSSRFASVYIANGTVGMMREWVKADFPVSSQTIAEIMYFYSKKLAQYW